MRFQGFIGPSYTLQSVNTDSQRCVNLYPELDELGTAKEAEVASLVSTPGLRLLVTLSGGVTRGVYSDSMGQLWAVAGNKVYQILSNWVATEIGTTLTNTGPVCFADNGLEVVLVDGTYGYSWTITAGSTFARITDSNFLGADQVCFLDGYLIFNKPDSQQFYITPLNAVTPFDALDIGAAQADPENLVGLIALQENLYLFSERHFEVFYNSGNASFPIERIQGAVIEIGCAAAFSIASIQTSVFWLAQDKNGKGMIYRAQGLQPQRISTYAIESQLASLSDISTARAWTYQQAGHSFYCLSVPNTNTTWVFDLTTNLWHERCYLSYGNYKRHLADSHAYVFNTNVVGDYSSGNIYALEQSTYTDNLNPIRRERTSPHISKDMNRIFHSRFQLDMETGVGLDGSGQGTNPQIMLRWSDDYGHSWSNEHWTTAGAIGTRKTRVIFRRLGVTRDRVYKVQITDPVKVTLLGAELDMEGGYS